MNVEAALFYNYHTVGDIVMAVIDSDAVMTSLETRGNITLIFHDSALIGINFFRVSEYCKIKSVGKLVLPPDALIDVLNSQLLPICDYQLAYIRDSMFVIGRILSVRAHPSSDHLHCLEVDIGSRILKIVCGAVNVKEGALCVVAKDGAVMMDGSLIRAGSLLGEPSEGMCCSPKELGMDIGYPPHHLLLLEESGVQAGQDFFLTKGGF